MTDKVKYYIRQAECILIPALLIYTLISGLWIYAALLLLVLFIMVWSIFDIRLAEFLPVLNRLNKKERCIALTFDDGPCEQTEKILDILASEHIKATFFVVGKQAEKYPLLLKRMMDDGHVIGTHTQNHLTSFPFMGIKRAKQEIHQGIESVEKIIGVKPVLFRPPFGITNPVIAYATACEQVNNIGWSLRSLDTRIDDSNKLTKRILRKLKPGKIILLHDHMPVTLKILPELITQIKVRGYQFVTICCI